MFKMILKFLFDLRAETPGSGAGAPGQAGQGGAPAGEGAAGGEGGAGDGGEGKPGGQGGEGTGAVEKVVATPGAKPKYGKFGDAPTVDQIWQEHQTLIGKTTQTERQAASLRKSLEAVGFRAVDDGSGNFRFEEIKAPAKTERAKRFNDQHKALFDEPVLTAIQNLVEDMFEDRIEKSFSDYEGKGQQRQQMIQQKIASGQKLIKLFPALQLKGEDGQPNAAFDETFYNRATEIWQGSPDYLKNPSGELFAAMEAAVELGIAPAAIAKAKADGFVAGTGAKKVLGPVTGGQQGAKGAKGELSQTDYLKLSPDEREKYDKEKLGINK